MSLYAACIALSAFLLFLVQPVIAKQILPWFGGSAAVWTTCMVFFQVVLLVGYAYSDFVVRRFAPRRQAVVHTLLLLASLTCLPITPSEAFKPIDAENPIGRILLLLAATIGLPFLMLSTTGPLVQAWFARHRTGGRVYRLYALSNVASMAALIAYPPLIEPIATNLQQSIGWSAGYVVFVLLALAAAWSAARPGQGVDAGSGPRAASAALASGEPGTATANARSDATSARAGTAPGWREQGLWLLLAALGSALLLSVTAHLTQDVASIPFLWVLPLSIYLVTFILSFEGRGWYRRTWYVPLACVLLMLMFAGLSLRPDWTRLTVVRESLPISEAVALYAIGLFVLCMVCHGELAARKPDPAHLTRFYLMVSLGGAMGSLFVGVVAPFAFDWYMEFPLALTGLALALIFLATQGQRPLAAAAFCVALIGFADYYRVFHEGTVELSRNFYAALRVKGDVSRLQLLNGVILHGDQFPAPALRRVPTTYYGTASGIGMAILGLREFSSGRPQRVGLIGMGTGTLAAYGRPGDNYRFYEINPQVLDLAQRRFTYLSDSEARIETRLGDARLLLEREASQQFDVLAVDAFSGDSIPVHLLTREAALLYQRHMAAGGVIAFHISNRYLDLSGVVRQLAQDIGWPALRVFNVPAQPSHVNSSDWILVSGNTALMAWLQENGYGVLIPRTGRLRPWTDDYNNLFGVLK